MQVYRPAFIAETFGEEFPNQTYCITLKE